MDTTTGDPTLDRWATHINVATALLSAPLAAACLEAFNAALPAGLGATRAAPLLASHPNRSTALFTAGYLPNLPERLARTLITRRPLTDPEAWHVITAEVRRSGDPELRRRLLGEVLFTACPALDDDTLGALVIAGGGTPCSGDRAEREQHAFAEFGIGTLHPLTDRGRAFYTDARDHDATMLTVRRRTTPPAHTPIRELADTALAALGPWLADRLGPRPAAWTILASAITADATAAQLADTVTAVLSPADTPAAAPTGRRRWTARLRASLRR